MNKALISFTFCAISIPFLSSCNSDNNKVASLEVTCNKNSFNVDEKIYKSNLTVNAIYKNKTKTEVNDYTIEWFGNDYYTFKLNDAGEKTFTVSYKQCSASFTVKVNIEPTLDKLQFIDLTSSEPYTCKVRKMAEDPSGAIIIPDTYEKDGKTYSVTEIASEGFKGCSNIDSVYFPSTLEYIGSKAFSGCAKQSYLSGNITYKLDHCNKLTGIGPQAFSSCGASSIKLPDSVVSIGALGFYNNWLYSFTLPQSLTTIGMNAFTGNRFSTITIPKNVTSIDTEAFMVIPTMKEVKVDSESIANATSNTSIGRLFEYATSIYIKDTISLNEDSYVYKNYQQSGTSEDGYKIYSTRKFKFSITDESEKKCSISAGLGCEKNITIPSTVNIKGSDYTVNEIVDFGSVDLESVVIPSTITKIHSGAFSTNMITHSIDYAYFEVSTGWLADTTPLNQYNIENPTIAATYLTDTYAFKTWTRN